MRITDFTFTELTVPEPPRRVVSLVPSTTESLFTLGAGDTLAGRTRYCISPADKVKAIEKIGGTKDPNLARILELQPDLVLANKEENRREDILHLREHGLTVYVDYSTTVEESLALVDTLGRMFGRADTAAGLVRAGVRALAALRLRAEEQEQANRLRVNPRPSARPRVVAFIWKDPWMAVGRETYAGDLIEALGGLHVLKDSPDRYVRLEPAAVAALNPDILLFPDEPFSFKPRDLDWWRANFPQIPAVAADRLRLCDGQDFVWIGTRTVEALGRLGALCNW
ncbi:MAG: ABC transporter substrate-binding protein [Planctomycetes bacterium]|nr:ABC transporter substrate-binding protein [Planctomycetota bacterium]MCL4730777.1 ABC transporter substrate-binding protein [Planctomycetota bacterium]